MRLNRFPEGLKVLDGGLNQLRLLVAACPGDILHLAGLSKALPNQGLTEGGFDFSAALIQALKYFDIGRALPRREHQLHVDLFLVNNEIVDHPAHTLTA